ncbi:MAG: ketoacyl-ACP synthase III [Candidatus Eisenbacteria bacterium]|uniref:Beta-ketoacyl-[acyl-carrier-protein] synthase III n=1 Tax=Eiseniibacteriota bacterium TaxID=2212470 RepID=A0A948RU51_UNCEI|nr:ketoacyl-ACP synthase III [Candidatus Eisenbacteria bacterium]MBU1948923.1 ketoacyl-ACP synthase III [Candidatus Eisenbacteria bacterium]MBU2690591.1 ketoacyl-ACP synthase III [Candidatus Eisenbacteria bacterium]
MPAKQPVKNVQIVGTGSYVPERVLTNADLEKIVDTTDEWIVTRTGIHERRISSPEQASSDLAEMASRRALEDAGIDPLELDAIIVATVTPDHFFPNASCLLQYKLGANNALAFDVSAACSGFLYALHVGRCIIMAQEMKTVLVIGVESLSKITDYTDRTTCILFGDGAGAAVLRPGPPETGILGTILGADGSFGPLIQQIAGGSRVPWSQEALDNRLQYLKMRGNEVFKIGVRAMENACRQVLDKTGLTTKDVDILIPHQANIRIIEALAKRLEIAHHKVIINIDHYGNTSAASVAIGLDEGRRSGKIKSGDTVLTVAFGGGVTWASSVIRWA